MKTNTMMFRVNRQIYALSERKKTNKYETSPKAIKRRTGSGVHAEHGSDFQIPAVSITKEL